MADRTHARTRLRARRGPSLVAIGIVRADADGAMPFAAKRSPAGDGALTDPDVKALAGALGILDECDRQTAVVSLTVHSHRSA